MITYNKLIRDRIPEIIADEGKDCTVRTLTSEEYVAELRNKLQEEVEEFLTSNTVEEIADIFEVLEHILREKGITMETVLEIKEAKRTKRGGFEKKIFLETVSS